MFPLTYKHRLALKLLFVVTMVLFTLKAGAQYHRQNYYHDELLANSFSINGNFNNSIFERNSSYNYAKGISVELEVPFSKENYGFDRFVSGYANIGILTRQYSDAGQPGGPTFYQGNAGLQLGNYFWNDDGSVAFRPHAGFGFNYRSQSDAFSPGNNLAVKFGVGVDFVLSGQNLNSNTLHNFDLVFFNSISADSRFGKTNGGKYTLPTEMESGMKVVYKW